jgi:hypothetical protein
MLTTAPHDNVEINFEDLLKSKEDVYRVDSTECTPDLGKWNISTNKDHYSDLTKWIDLIIANFFEQVNQDDTEPMDKFPEPKRLTQTPVNHNTSSVSSTYAKKNQAAFSTASTTASAPSIPCRGIASL